MPSSITPPNASVTDDFAKATTVARPLLDYLFPGFTLVSDGVLRHLNIDINRYIPILMVFSVLTFVWNYISNFFWGYLEEYCMCTVDIRYEDEIYDAVVHWVSRQSFASSSRRFVVVSNASQSRNHYWNGDNDSDSDDDEPMTHEQEVKKHRGALAYTPSFGSHNFWFRGHLLRFNRADTRKSPNALISNEREEISISSYSRNPDILKDLLIEARMTYAQKDSQKTVIFRAICRYSNTEPIWQRIVSRSIRPMSTVILNKKLKQELMSDVTDYLNPATRRWYSNRGIPYRRGYLLYGPPGTGKSSFSLALAGHFKMRVYIISLSSATATEENLSQLFSCLPRRCVVLLEDIDSAGLTHTRDEPESEAPAMGPSSPTAFDSASSASKSNRLSLSGLLNILDGVASNEGRLLIMTTNHLEKLDSALIRPGRVDMAVEFGLADTSICKALFQAIFSSFADDDPLYSPGGDVAKSKAITEVLSEKAMKKLEQQHKAKQAAYDAEIASLSTDFAAKVPEHEFSPAELQGFLLRYKLQPQQALENIDEWVAVTREKKRKEKKEKEENELKEKEKEKQKEKEKEKEQKPREVEKESTVKQENEKPDNSPKDHV
ncbi:hypothetical protein TD95_004490 [Thielaviopsis punctulata]|uniref:AAA+ ATPase domain-containing protein n=1 Tax=Thielaviopsis punctulata TaxID=72032 RepID=A0A0F4ZFK1_9PEZI|nr:hypothetical protein TD95_004490 [Thielaviopsis punctulata]